MCTHIGVMHVGRLVAQGTVRGAARPAPGRRPRCDTDQPEEAARMLRELGLADVRVGARAVAPAVSATSRRRRSSRPACTEGVPVTGSGGRPVPGGRLRLSDRGGLRCQRLRRPSRRPCRNGPSRPSTRFLRSELRLVFAPPPQPRRAAGARGRAGADLRRGEGVSPTGTRGGPDFFSSITENGLFVALAALTIEMGLFLPLAVAASPVTPSPARPTSGRCATCSPSRCTGPGCWR